MKFRVLKARFSQTLAGTLQSIKWQNIYPELGWRFQCIKIWGRRYSIFKGLQKHLLEIQHFWQTAEQGLHLWKTSGYEVQHSVHLTVDLRKQSTKEMWPTEVEKANNIFVNTFQTGFIKKKTLQKSKGFLDVKS